MAINTRQSNLLVAEDWKKVYQTFREADFTSYDFETLRKSMIDYLRLNYPEDFNDFTESSEYIALIDLIAFLGQSLAFRTDMNARENFIDTAERRDSILKLARLVNYNPKRNIAASGSLKIDSVSTTENLFDSNGLNIGSLIVSWNDPSNENWVEQFTGILNAAFVDTQVIGRPGNSTYINSVKVDEYGVNIPPGTLPIFSYQADIEDKSAAFEIVSGTTSGKEYIYEMPPTNLAQFNVLYKNDSYGNESENTGFFLYFKQGTLKSYDFTINEVLPNRTIDFDFLNVNNSDVWLYEVNSDNTLGTLWESVPTISGLNVIYNSSPSNKNVYQINSLANDNIQIVFGDGSFANVPFGNYRLYYRESLGVNYKITPDEMQGVLITVPYISRIGREETLSIRASLQYTVANASARESATEIKQKAPQQYYTQNRMISGEDYNILPYTNFNNIVKVKSVNRTSSGISRYLDTIDPTGRFSSTNIFASDGILYKDTFVRSIPFNFRNFTEINKMLHDEIIKNIISSVEMKHFYYDNYFLSSDTGLNDRYYSLTNTTWNLVTIGTNEFSGYLTTDGVITPVGDFVRGDARFVSKGAIVRFVPAEGYYFDANNNMIPGDITQGAGYIYASIHSVVSDGTADGTGLLETGRGPVAMGVKVPTGAVVDKILPVFKNKFPTILVDSVVDLIKGYRNFGLTYSVGKQQWIIINPENLDPSETFSFDYAGSLAGTGDDNSWLIKFVFDGTHYSAHYRGVEYILQSANETNFYHDEKIKIYDSKTGLTINDTINILKSNSKPDDSSALGLELKWNIYKNFVDVDGKVSNEKVYITYADLNSDGIADNPDLFSVLVDPDVNTRHKFVYFKTESTLDNFLTLVPVDKNLVNSYYTSQYAIGADAGLFGTGQIFYVYEENKFYQKSSSGEIVELLDYVAHIGRQGLYFQYRHNSPDYRRIDPSSSNINEIFVLTSNYALDYVSWIRDSSGTVAEPTAPTVQELSLEYSSLNDIKALSDTLVFNTAKFKPVFGTKSDPALRAIFKVVKNSSVVTSDNEVKSMLISAINDYFDLENWDFGETFYFSELSAYLHKVLTPMIASISIVPVNPTYELGTLYQINAEPNEIIISSATVDDVEIISAITAAQLRI